MSYAPIALFVYERLEHLQETVSSLQKNALAKESLLYVFSDGPKNNNEKKITEIRQWVKQISGFKEIHTIFRDQNLGLASSIIQGVTQCVSEWGKVIVLEDDIVVSEHFLTYMNESLSLYEHEDRIASIHGYNFPLQEKLPETFFMRGADCWGWATWKRAWDKFEPDGNKLLTLLKQKKLEKQFNYEGTQPNIQMLKDQINGKNNSWAIRWHASAFVNNMLTLYPGKSLVSNIGLDNSGTHCMTTNWFDVQRSDRPVHLEPIPIEENVLATKAFVRYFKSLKLSFFDRIGRKFKGWIKQK